MRLTDDQIRDAYERYRADRAQILMLAEVSANLYRRLGPHGFCQHAVTHAPDTTAATNMFGALRWHQCGLQSVELSHKLAAALMATSAVGALDHAHMPWPAFEIRVPPGLLESSHGEVYTCLVHCTPDWIPPQFHATNSGEPLAGVIVLYYDERTIGHVGLRSLAEVARFEPETFPETNLGKMRELVRAEYDQSKEDRVKQLLMRLVTGVILLVNEARADKPTAFPTHPLRPAKRGAPRVNTHRLTRAVTIDVTQNVRDFCRGTNRDSPHVTTLVRGHWRQQAHGPRHSLRRTQWIEPFWRGEGPLQVRPTKLADREP